MTEPTRADIARFFEMFKNRGPHEWSDGTPVADRHVLLAFALDLWLMVFDSGQGGAFLPGWSDPVEALTGASNLRATAERVNESPIGRRWARKGAPLARRDFWEEIVVPLPNPSDIVWGYSRELVSFAGAGVVEGGVFVAAFPAAAYTPILEGLRHAVPSRQDPEGILVGLDGGESVGVTHDAPPLGRVLIADRHQLVRQGLVRYLGNADFDVVATAVDGAQALRLVGELRPDVLITDIRLPAIDGLQLAATVREQFPHVRVVILTTYDEELFIEAARASGVVAYILKAESAERLISVLRAVVQGEADLGMLEHASRGREVGSALPERPDVSNAPELLPAEAPNATDPDGQAGTGRLPGDSVRTEEAAIRMYQEATERWDRALLRGSRDGLAEAAEELDAMGPAGAPWAHKLLRRVAEIDAEKERRQRVLRWCDRSPIRRLAVMGDARGQVGWVSTEALTEEQAGKVTEDGRRLLMVSVAREARRIEEAASGAPARLQLGDMPGETLEDAGHPQFGWRFDGTKNLPPTPERIVEWWETNRGPVSVRCSLHGEIAQFDAGDWIGMLSPAWDAAVVEYHNRWELRWDETYDTPEYDGCDVRVESTSNPGGSNLLDVEEMWIVTEGAGRPWWPYSVLPGRRSLGTGLPEDEPPPGPRTLAR